MPMDERAYMTGEKAVKKRLKRKKEVPYRALKVFQNNTGRVSKLCTAQNKETEKEQKSSLFCTMKIYKD